MFGTTELLGTLEMFATKGTEYLLILAYLALLIPFWFILNGASRHARRAIRAVVDWFSVPDDVAFDTGHTWARRVAPDRVRVGVDDLAQAFVGAPDAITLPAIGSQLAHGDLALSLTAAGNRFPLRSPVTGEVVAVNREVLADPTRLADPYGAGWLLEVRVPTRRHALRGLLTGERARLWMVATVDTLRARMGGEVGPVLQDGGTPMSSFGRHLGDDWTDLASDLFQSPVEAAPDAGEENAP